MHIEYLDFLMILLLLSDLALMGSSRLRVYLRIVALQGILIGCLPAFVGDMMVYEAWLLGAAIILLKGLVFPYYLRRVARDSRIRRESEPFIGFSTSIIIGVILLAVSFWLGKRLPLPFAHASWLILPATFFTIATGFFLLTTRRIALTQALGYLVFENGIFILGIQLAGREPLLVEMGILLDLFVMVFIMGLVLFHIHRHLDHMDTDQMDTLRDI